MKSIAILKTLGVALALTVACGAANAQDTASAPAAAMGKPAPTAKKADRKLGYTVRKALAKGQGIDVSNITVRSRGGVVTLTGSVPDQGQIDKAGTVAQGVSGVTSVNNKLTVVQQ